MKHTLPSHLVQGRIRIALAGAGGNGSQMLSGLARLHLALSALGHPGLDVTVFDPDIVTPANIGRQLFSPSDVDCYKADVLVNRINCFFNLAWKAQPTKYTRQSGGTHLLIGCVDSATARRELMHARWEYWLDLGNMERKGQVVLGQKPKRIRSEAADTARRMFNRKMTAKERAEDAAWQKFQPLPTIMELFPELKNKRRKVDNTPSCSLAEALEKQDLFINQTVATFALQLLWQFIRQGGLDIHGYFINLESGRVSPLPIKAA